MRRRSFLAMLAAAVGAPRAADAYDATLTFHRPTVHVVQPSGLTSEESETVAKYREWFPEQCNVLLVDGRVKGSSNLPPADHQKVFPNERLVAILGSSDTRRDTHVYRYRHGRLQV